MTDNLKTRIIVAAVLIPGAVILLWLGRWPLAVAIAALGVLGAWEVFGLAEQQGVKPLREFGYVTAAAIPLATYAAIGRDPGWAEFALYAGVLWALVLLIAAMFLRGPRGRPLASVAVTLFAPLYASATLAFLIVVRHGGNSDRRPLAYLCLALFPLVLTWICDTAAYAAGTKWGGAKLLPEISPGKTWAGAAGGLGGALVFAVVLGAAVLNRVGWHFGVVPLLVVGLLVGVVAQVGDLAESLLKREAGMKDSSSLIPGHGGVLDRLDSLYFIIPASAALLRLYGVI